MIKIGILHCLGAMDVCAGCGCLLAFYERSGAFEIYKGIETELSAFFTCNGCSSINPLEPEVDSGILEKVERLGKEGTEIVHVGICCLGKEGTLCSRIEKIIKLLEEEKIRVVIGTHS